MNETLRDKLVRNIDDADWQAGKAHSPRRIQPVDATH